MEFKSVGKSVNKVDGISLAVGEEKFVADIKLDNPLHLAMLYSPHPYAKIKSIDVKSTLKLDGVVDVLYYENVPRVLHTTAGQGYPEPSPYDTRLFDDKVRYVGDRVALVVAESIDAARQGVKRIEVEYEPLKPVFDAEEAISGNAPAVHTDDEHVIIFTPYDPQKNLVAEVKISFGDVDAGFKSADFTDEHVYDIHQASHCALEPHAAISYFDERGRLVIVSTTQVPFHVRRIVSMILSVPAGKIRVIKPRIGGGFGGKQEILLEPYVALVAMKHKRPARFVMSRREVFVSARTRNPMKVKLKVGYKRDGEITAFKMHNLMNGGAYGSHGLTVLSNSGSKVLPLFNKIENMEFLGRTVYTNIPVGGAYRGYGATQSYFAVCQQIDMIARRTNQDVLKFCKKWHIKEGETSPVFEALGEGKEGVEQTVDSCKLDECIDMGAKAIDWYAKRGKKIRTGDKIKGMGLSISMQGSGIPRIDMGSASMKMNEDGSFNLFVGATDIGTGSDTILAQIAAEVLETDVFKMIVRSSDTDITPFDVGAYASSTTYVSGMAVLKCAEKIKAQIVSVASEMLGAPIGELELVDASVVHAKSKRSASFEDVAVYALYTNNQFQIQASASNVSDKSPPPFIAQFAEVDVDIRTGRIDVVEFVSAVDCGQPVNPQLVEGQVEGAVVNGLGYAMCEEYIYDDNGRMKNPNFWDYKIYSPSDLPKLKTIIVNSYDASGPFGAKSVAEIAINGPLPAIANAVYDAVGVRLFGAPFTPERVLRAMNVHYK